MKQIQSIQLTGPFVLIETTPPTGEVKSAGGIFLPHVTDQAPTVKDGVVAQIGPGVEATARVGQRVLVLRWEGPPVRTSDHKQFHIAEAKNIVAILDEGGAL